MNEKTVAKYPKLGVTVERIFTSISISSSRRPKVKFGRNVVRKTTKNSQDEDKKFAIKLILRSRSIMSKRIPNKDNCILLAFTSSYMVKVGWFVWFV